MQFDKMLSISLMQNHYTNFVRWRLDSVER